MSEESIFRLFQALLPILYIASLIHVWRESKAKRRVGHALGHTLMCAVVAWPLAYLAWILWWPGSLRQWILGSDKEKSEQRVRLFLERKRNKPW